MPLNANNPDRTSWLHVDKNSDFPIQNIPFGVFLTRDDIITIGTRIGDTAIDLGALHQLGYFDGIPLTDDIFLQDSLNDFIADGRKTWRSVRNRIAEIFDADTKTLKDNVKHKEIVLFRLDEIEMQLPVQVGDFTNFHSSFAHATQTDIYNTVDGDKLIPSWLHMPLAHHGRSSSVIPSGIPVHRPLGQILAEGESSPSLAPSNAIDFELEMAFITTAANDLGEPIPVEEAEEYIFGLVLLNDWSARDLQKWEHKPLGPFLSKNFASSISPWIITLDALEPFRTNGPKPEKKQLPYLKTKGAKSFDVNLEVALQPKGAKEMVVSTSNFKYVYWNISQQLAHHTINGCPINSGDLMGSGTISGPETANSGSMLGLTNNGANAIKMHDGTERKFVHDNDTVIMRGYCEKDGTRIGFGEVSTKLLPVYSKK